VLLRGSCEPGPEAVGRRVWPSTRYADQEMERLTAVGRDSLETVGAQLPAVPMESMVRLGELAEEILLEAEAFGADAIVLAAGRPSWFKRVTGGGIGQWLLRKAPVPVVLVRST